MACGWVPRQVQVPRKVPIRLPYVVGTGNARAASGSVLARGADAGGRCRTPGGPRRAGRPGAGRPGPGRLQRRPRLGGPGGRAGATRRRGPGCAPAPSPSTTACSPARRTGPRRSPPSSSTSGWTPVEVATATVGGSGGPEARRPDGPLPRPGRGRRPARRRRRAARPHPRRPGRDRAARPGPRLRRPLAGRHGRRSAAATAARCSTSPRDTVRAAAAGHPTWDDPHNDDPAFARTRVRRDAPPRPRARARSGRRRRPGPRRPTSCGPTPTRWTTGRPSRCARPAVPTGAST